MKTPESFGFVPRMMRSPVSYGARARPGRFWITRMGSPNVPGTVSSSWRVSVRLVTSKLFALALDDGLVGRAADGAQVDCGRDVLVGGERDLVAEAIVVGRRGDDLVGEPAGTLGKANEPPASEVASTVGPPASLATSDSATPPSFRREPRSLTTPRTVAVASGAGGITGCEVDGSVAPGGRLAGRDDLEVDRLRR